MSELFESSSALVAALILVETPGGSTRCRLCFQHGWPEQDRVIEHLSTCPVGRVGNALIDRVLAVYGEAEKAGDPPWDTASAKPASDAASKEPISQGGTPAAKHSKGRRKP